MSFSIGELEELRRAMSLIANEDRSCHVNMDPESVRDKASALAKLNRATGWKDRLAGAKSVRVQDVVGESVMRMPKP